MGKQLEEKPRLLGVRGSELSDNLAERYARRFNATVAAVRGRRHIGLKAIAELADPDEYNRLAGMAKPLSAPSTEGR